MSMLKMVCDKQELLEALQDHDTLDIMIEESIGELETLYLKPGLSISAESPDITLSFIGDGLELSSNNTISSVTLKTNPKNRAIFNRYDTETLGRIEIDSVTTIGSVQLLAREQIKAGNIEIIDLHITASDTLDRTELPNRYGVNVTQGALTLWNMQTEQSSISVSIEGITLGQEGAPVLGGGIFICGSGNEKGKVYVRSLETEAIFTDGKIAAGTPDRITGGVFTLYDVHCDYVCNYGPVTTYGANDMVLDNWGYVGRWIAEEKLTSFGSSGIGFVNFGIINEITIDSTIETFGLGARGFNVYTGTVSIAEFDRIVTHGDGAVGIQISQPVGSIIVNRGIETFGGTGDSLVKGQVVTLSATGFSIKPGGQVNSLEVRGGIFTHGENVKTLELEGNIENLHIRGGCANLGNTTQG